MGARVIPHRRSGLTLVETIVVIFVFSLLFLTLTRLLMGGVAVWKVGQARNDLRATGRAALDFIAADFRQAVYDPVGAPVTPATGSTSKSFTLRFKRLPMGNPTAATSSQQWITYTIGNQTLIRDDGTNKVVIATNVDDSAISGTPVNSYFQWASDNISGSDYTNLRINLSLIQNAKYVLSASKTQHESLTLTTTIYQMNYPVAEDTSVEYTLGANGTMTPGGATNSPGVVTASYSAVPSDLADPRAVPFRSVAGGPRPRCLK